MRELWDIVGNYGLPLTEAEFEHYQRKIAAAGEMKSAIKHALASAYKPFASLTYCVSKACIEDLRTAVEAYLNVDAPASSAEPG